MADRFVIRSFYTYIDMFYDAFLIAGASIVAYSCIDREGQFVAEEGQSVVVDRPIGMQVFQPGLSSFYIKWMSSLYRVPHYLEEPIKVQVVDKSNKLIQLNAILRLHAMDPFAAAKKYKSELRPIYEQRLIEKLKRTGQRISQNEIEDLQSIESLAFWDLKVAFQRNLSDPNILHEVDLTSIERTPIKRKVYPQLL